MYALPRGESVMKLQKHMDLYRRYGAYILILCMGLAACAQRMGKPNVGLRKGDIYARVLDAESYRELLASTYGTFIGIGVDCNVKKNDDGSLTIRNVVPLSPAAKAGVKKHDVLVAINANPVKSLSLSETIERLRGEKLLSNVAITVRRGKKALDFTIARDYIPEESCSHALLEQDSILYCSMSAFTRQTASQLRAIAQQMSTKKLKGMILDLRDNGGGLLQAAVDCAGLFLPQQSLVVTTKTGGGTEHYRTSHAPLFLDIPIVILINEATASCAELFAQALTTHAQCVSSLRKGVLSSFVVTVGTRTFGKGSVQEILPVANDCAIQRTIGLYYGPDGTTPDGIGIAPDFTIASGRTDSCKGSDTQLAYACDLIIRLTSFPKKFRTRSAALAWLRS